MNRVYNVAVGLLIGGCSNTSNLEESIAKMMDGNESAKGNYQEKEHSTRTR